MVKIIKKNLLLIFVFSLLSFIPSSTKVRIYLAGDSTVSNYEMSRAPLTGWGMPFSFFFDSTVTVVNKAMGGRSTRTFISEGRWKSIVDSLKEGDYVFIQFGHNDEAKEEKYKDRYTPVEEYKKNLIKFIDETRIKNAIPILITPVTRMRFDKNNNIEETHKEYSSAVWEVGKTKNVAVIDLDAESRKLLQQFGPQNSKLLFMQLDSLEHPNYPNGQKDNTHFNEFGARKIAEIVLSNVRRQVPELAKRIVIPRVK